MSGKFHNPRALVIAVLIAGLALLPLYAQTTGNAFLLTLRPAGLFPAAGR